MQILFTFDAIKFFVMRAIFNWCRQNPGEIFKWLLFSCLIYFPIFLDLDVLPLRLWDESRLAENAYEMNKYGNYLVTHFLGLPEMWNTKPPLMLWMQVLCMKIIGVSVLAVRLPSAIATALTCIMLMVFTIKFFKSFWWGFTSCLVLVTSQGFISMHVSRTGDYDALMTLFTTFYCLCFYAYVETNRNKYITMAFLGLTLACFTKGIAGLLFVPGLCLFAIIKKRAFALLRNKIVYVNLALFLFLTAGYYLLRNLYNPGYLSAVYDNELMGRYFNVSENHPGDFWYYYQNMIDSRFSFWYLLLPAGVIIGLANKNTRIRDFILFLTLLVVIFFLVLSYAQTKIYWYDAPMYPLLALIIGGLFYFAFTVIDKIEHTFSLKSTTLYFLVIYVFYIPYNQILNQTYRPDEAPNDKDFYHLGKYLQDAIKGKRTLRDYHIYYKEYNQQNLFYTDILNDEGGKIDFTQGFDFKKGDKVILCQPNQEDSLKKKYYCSLLDADENVKAYQIDSIKE